MILRKLESSLRAKEQLAEGLHLIDFEQLKIENQTLNAKVGPMGPLGPCGPLPSVWVWLRARVEVGFRIGWE